MLDMTESIAPRSDQMNAEDLLGGPRTFTITEVRKGSAEQPINVYLAEFPPDRPFKPGLTVRRIMVLAWGKDASEYVGKRLTLYRDPAVKFGGMDVGGIRVSHMSDLKKPLTVALAASKGKRTTHTVKPLADEPARPTFPREHFIDRAQRAKTLAVWREVWQDAKSAGVLDDAMQAELKPYGEALKASAGDPTDAAPRDVIPVSVQQATPVVDELPAEDDGWPETATIPGTEGA